MNLQNLSLINFRNYKKLDFEFKSEITVLTGDNAQGKSNFLESIFYLSTTKSPKADKDSQLIQDGENFSHAKAGIFSEKAGETTLEINMSYDLESNQLSKRVKVNGISKRIIDYIGNLLVIHFSPDDINLVAGTPSLRRWHLDLVIALVDRNYKKSLTEYFDVIIRRNRVLKNIKEGQSRKDELDFWNQQMLYLGGIVQEKRESFFAFINGAERKFGEFELIYHQSKLTEERLREYEAREIASCASLIGPHRDDFEFSLGSKNLANFGSRGEGRSAVLDLKVAEALYVEKSLGERPILLLDDVFSELDQTHRKHVLDLVLLQQTIIATLELDSFIKESLKGKLQIVKVSQGRLTF